MAKETDSPETPGTKPPVTKPVTKPVTDPVPEVSIQQARLVFLDPDDPDTDEMLLFRVTERLIRLGADRTLVSLLRALKKAADTQVQARHSSDYDTAAALDTTVQSRLERAWYIAAGQG